MVLNPLFAYLGPETMLPLASFFAAIIGGLLMGWRYVVAAIRSFFAMITGRKKADDTMTTQVTPTSDAQE